MWKPFKYNMRLVTFLLLIQMEYIIAKAIENPSTCNDSPKNDPRLKRSDEKDIQFDSEDTTENNPDDFATRKTFSKPNNENDSNHDITDNYVNSNKFAINSKSLPQKLPLVNKVTKFPAIVENGDIMTDTFITTKDTPLQEPVYYKAIDPKYLIISGLSLPKPTKNITNVSKSEGPVNIDLKETITTPLDYSNLTKAMDVLNRNAENKTLRKEVVINDADTDVSNIRELREHLLDHLLDYFLNIIKEENYIRNDTRKKNGKDRMKVEEKLRNYYDPHHLDMLFVDDDDDDYYDKNLDPAGYREGNDSEEDLLDNVKQNKEVNKENFTNIDSLNTPSDNVDNKIAEAHTSEYLQNEALNLEQTQNTSISNFDGESFKVNLSELSPVYSKYVNLIEKENYFRNALLNMTENPEEGFDSNINIITTTERFISNETLDDKAAEIDTDLLNSSEEVVTDRIEYVYDNGVLTVDDYTSYEDYTDSDEYEVAQNVTVHENDRDAIVITTENGRRKNGLHKEKYIANGTLNETDNTKHSQIIRNEATTSKDIASEKHIPKKLAILDLSNKNINDNSPCNEDSLAENNLKKNSSKNSTQCIKSKLRNNKNYGKLVNKLINKKSNKHNCRKSIILNLNINLI